MRKILKSLGSLTCCFIMAATPSMAAMPNVIYILADDLGVGDLSCYGQKKFETPNIDRLAREGIRFTNHYAGNTVCSPSRAVLMTGQHSGHCYLRSNAEENRYGALPSEMIVLPEVFKSAGYRTGAFGKWGLGVTSFPGDPNPLSHGFDEFFGWKSQIIAHTYFPSSYVKNGKEIPLEKGTYLDSLVMQAARDFITTSVQEKKPFFCYIPTPIPHAAMHAPPELHDKWRKKLPQFDDVIGTYTAGSTESCSPVINPIAAFAAMMEHLDNEVGRILELLSELKISDNTIVIFASDNGPHVEGGHDPKFWNSSGGLRGHKRKIYEGGIRSPLLARWPGKIPPGTTSHHLSGFHDVLPTVTDLTAQAVPEQNTGISFLPTLLGKAEEQKKHEYIYIEFRMGDKQVLDSQALRFGDWKVFRKAGHPMELYKLDEDPAEQRDLAGQEANREVLATAEKYLLHAAKPLPER